MFKTENLRNTRISNLDKSVFLYINSESRGIIGSNNNFTYDISNLPLDKNKSYNLYVKNVYFPSNSPQITNLYNYNKINYEIYRDDTGAVQTTRLITIDEGTYSSSQLAFNVARVFNNDFGSLSGTYGGDVYTFTYDDITNRISVKRDSVTLVGGVKFNVRFLSNDSNSKFQGEPGFGMGYVLGIEYDSFINFPNDIVTNAGLAVFPNPTNLTPYLYYYLLIDGVNNLNSASDLPNVNNIVFKCPLTVAPGRYSYVYVDEANPDFNQLFVSTLPSRINVKVVDQYGNNFPLSQNSAIDITLKIKPTGD